MNLYMLEAIDGRSPLQHRQMVHLRDGMLIEPCHSKPMVYHPIHGMEGRAVMEIVAMQPELLDCSFCNNHEPKWQYGFEPYEGTVTFGDQETVRYDGWVWPYVACEECYVLLETQAPDAMGRRCLEAGIVATDELRQAHKDTNVDDVWAEVGSTVIGVFREFITRKHHPVPFDPARWRAGEIEPIDCRVPTPVSNGHLH